MQFFSCIRIENLDKRQFRARERDVVHTSQFFFSMLRMFDRMGTERSKPHLALAHPCVSIRERSDGENVRQGERERDEGIKSVACFFGRFLLTGWRYSRWVTAIEGGVGGIRASCTAGLPALRGAEQMARTRSQCYTSTHVGLHRTTNELTVRHLYAPATNIPSERRTGVSPRELYIRVVCEVCLHPLYL